MFKKHWMPTGISLACLLGFVYPRAGEFLSPYLPVMIGGLMLLMGAGIGFRRFSSRLNSWRPVALVMTVTYVAAPLAGWLLAKAYFSGQPQLYTGLILTATTSTTLSTCIIFTRLAGGDEALALWLSVCSSLLATVVSPMLLYLMLGHELDVPVGILIRKLIVVLFAPLTAGMLLRAALGEHKIAPVGGILTRFCSIIVLTVIMVAVSRGRELLAGPGSLKIIAAAGSFYLAMLLLWKISSSVLHLSREQRIATLFCSVEKTLQIPAYLAISLLGTPMAAVYPVVHHVVVLVADSLIVSYFKSRMPSKYSAEITDQHKQKAP